MAKKETEKPKRLFEVSRNRAIELRFPEALLSHYGYRTDFTKNLTSSEARDIAEALLDHAALLDSREVSG